MRSIRIRGGVFPIRLISQSCAPLTHPERPFPTYLTPAAHWDIKPRFLATAAVVILGRDVWRKRVLPARSSSPRWGWAGRRRTAHPRCGYSRPWRAPFAAESSLQSCLVARGPLLSGFVWFFFLRVSSSRVLPRRVVPASVRPACVSVRRRRSDQTNSGAAPAAASPPPLPPPSYTRWRERPLTEL